MRSWFSKYAVLLLCLTALPLPAQYTDRAAMQDLGGPQEFARRRQELAKQLKTGYALLFANINLPEANHYREDNDFYYLTGLADPGAVLLLDIARNEATIFEPVQSDRMKRTLGPNLLALSKEEQAALGYANVQPLELLNMMLSGALGHGGEPELWVRLGYGDKPDGARMETAMDYAAHYSHPFGADLPGDRGLLRRLAERFPAARLRDLTPSLDALRNIKTPQEIAVLRRNGKLSAEGIRRAMARARAGIYQYQIEAEASYAFRNSGAQGVAYPAIVASGGNINTVHYSANRNQTQANELVVFDYGADLHQLTMDITRTFNVSGKFTPEQAKWYAVDLEAQKTIINMLRPGNTYEQAAAAGKAVYEKAGIADQFRRFPGHFVGLATHDVMRPTGPIKAGQVVTVEPIIEFADKKMHFRVEDTVLITEGAPEVLTSGVPKEMAEVEKLVGSERQ